MMQNSMSVENEIIELKDQVFINANHGITIATVKNKQTNKQTKISTTVVAL